VCRHTRSTISPRICVSYSIEDYTVVKHVMAKIAD